MWGTPCKMAVKVDHWSWPVLLGASFLSGLLVGYWIRTRRGSSPLEGRSSETEHSYMSATTGETKMVLVVRSDLKMGKGKIGAQCGHAVLSAYKKMVASAAGAKLVHMWEDYGQPKVVVKVDSEEDLLQLMQKALSMGLNASVVRDAGRTQIAPGSKTVLAIGPGPSEQVDEVTGHLKLL